MINWKSCIHYFLTLSKYIKKKLIIIKLISKFKSSTVLEVFSKLNDSFTSVIDLISNIPLKKCCIYSKSGRKTFATFAAQTLVKKFIIFIVNHINA